MKVTLFAVGVMPFLAGRSGYLRDIHLFRAPAAWWHDRDETRDGDPGAGDDDLFAGGDALEEARKMGLGLMDVNLDHTSNSRLSG